MSATDELRRLLDERGVEWRETALGETRWLSTVLNGNASAKRINDKLVLFTGYKLITPEQAIAATLGRGECHNTSKVMDEHGQACFVCSGCHAWIASRTLWNPEYPNGESPLVMDCKLNFCPNCGRKVVDA